MRIVEYTPECYTELSETLAGLGVTNALLHSEAYLRHQYATHPTSRLWMLRDRGNRLAGLLAIQQIRIRIGHELVDATVGSNTYSIAPGAFAFLMLHWMRTAEIGLILPGNPKLDAIVAQSPRWQRIRGLRAYHLNWRAGGMTQGPAWKRWLRPLADYMRRKDPARIAKRLIASREEPLLADEVATHSEDMIDIDGNFGFKVAVDGDYLTWRYPTRLGHAHYRLFRLSVAGMTRGYVVMAEWPHRLVVAHCDGDSAELLARGILLAISQVNCGRFRFREVALTSMHESMSSIFLTHGFVADPRERPFYIASFRGPDRKWPNNGDWLVNVDLGDYGALLGTHYTPARQRLISGASSTRDFFR